MSDDDALRWDERYAAGEYAARTHPTRLLETWATCAPRGAALDVACGAGRNAVYLAGLGYQVDAIDVSAVALDRARATAAKRGVQVNWRCEDLDTAELTPAHYRLVVVARFLDRDLFPALLDCLAPGGYLVYETHLRTSAGDVGGPSGQRFRLRPQELLHLAHGLRVVHYFEGIVRDPGGAVMALAQLVGCNGTGDF